MNRTIRTPGAQHPWGALIGLHAAIDENGVTPTFVVSPPGIGKLTIFAGVVILSSHVHVQVTMHAHTLAPGQHEDLNGNKVIGNKIGTNNLDDNTLDPPASPTDPKTTGVLVFCGGTPVWTVIAHNRISGNHFGVWLSKPVHAAGLGTNSFRNVKVPVSAGH